MHIRQSYITVFTRSTNHQHLDRKMLIVTFCWVTWAGSMWEDFFPSTFSSWEFIVPQLSSCIAFFNAWATSSKVGSFATAACGVATGRPCGFSLREDACCWASTTCKFNLAGLIGPKSVDWRWKNDRNSPHPHPKPKNLSILKSSFVLMSARGWSTGSPHDPSSSCSEDSITDGSCPSSSWSKSSSGCFDHFWPGSKSLFTQQCICAHKTYLQRSTKEITPAKSHRAPPISSSAS